MKNYTPAKRITKSYTVDELRRDPALIAGLVGYDIVTRREAFNRAEHWLHEQHRRGRDNWRVGRKYTTDYKWGVRDIRSETGECCALRARFGWPYKDTVLWLYLRRPSDGEV